MLCTLYNCTARVTLSTVLKSTSKKLMSPGHTCIMLCCICIYFLTLLIKDLNIVNLAQPHTNLRLSENVNITER